MEEIEHFIQNLNLLEYLKVIGYNQIIHEEIYNEHNNELIFYRRTYFNSKWNRKCMLTYQPTTRKSLSGVIDIILTNKNRSISVSSYLAFKKTRKPVSFKDQMEFHFVVDKSNWKDSQLRKLVEINNLLESEFSELLDSDYWFQVPVEDPRDRY